MWRAVDQATRAVAETVDAGAPVGDLPSLGRRLRSTAEALDRLLVIGSTADPATAEMATVRRQAGDVLAAAAGIRSAAMAATVAVGTEAAEIRVRELVADTDREVRSLAAGVDRSRSSAPRPL